MCWFNYVSTTSALIWYQVRQVLELRAFANERQAKGGGLAKHKQNLTLCLVSLVWNPAKLCWVYGVCLSRRTLPVKHPSETRGNLCLSSSRSSSFLWTWSVSECSPGWQMMLSSSLKVQCAAGGKSGSPHSWECVGRSLALTADWGFLGHRI